MVWYHLGLIMQPLVGSCHQLNQSQSSIFYIPTPSILCYLTFDQRTVSFDRWLQTGIYADRCKHPLGRRRPFIILGSLSLLQTHYTDGIIIDQIHLDSIYPLIRLGQVWRPFYRFWSLSGHVRLSTWCSRASLIWYATLFLFFFPPQLFFIYLIIVIDLWLSSSMVHLTPLSLPIWTLKQESFSIWLAALAFYVM